MRGSPGSLAPMPGASRGENFTAGTGVNPRNPVPAVFRSVRYKQRGETQETKLLATAYVGSN